MNCTPSFKRGGLALILGLGALRLAAAPYTQFAPLPAPGIVSAAPSDVDRNFSAAYLVDGNPVSEYASAAQGLKTFVEFDFGSATTIAAFRHQDRGGRSTLSASVLTFYDAAGVEIARLPVTHSGRPGGVAFLPISPAIVARRVRWQVTKLGPNAMPDVGGAEITFFSPVASTAAPTALSAVAISLPIAEPAAGGGVEQTVRVAIDYPYARPIAATIGTDGQPSRTVRLEHGRQTFDFSVPVSDQPRNWTLAARDAATGAEVRRAFASPAFHPLTLYVIPHSHVDIGYTAIQTDIEDKQINNVFLGIAAAKRTANYPKDSRFIWNLENLWPVDLLLQRLNPERQAEFIQAVRDGLVVPNGMYANTLTGLCRPEELTQLFRFATELRAQTGVPLDSAMISDVPGYTWGTVAALRQAGIKYFSVAPNHFDRIGDLMVQWENKPFWWVGSSAQDRVLVWVPIQGYGLSHVIGHLSAGWLANYTEDLARQAYPYDLAYIRWSGRGDNALPDPEISDFIRDWNASHVSPHLIIGSVHDAFSALEAKDGDKLPSVRGDWTPYWEDGAGSSADETAVNRNASDRLAQAQALWAMQGPRSYPAASFADSMRHLLLYDEHTWGASESVRDPNAAAVLEEWPLKRGQAAMADLQSRDLLSRALSLANSGAPAPDAVDVFNANSWNRTDLVTLPKDLAVAGDRVTDDQGRAVPSQRLTNGKLAFLASEVPAFAARRYSVGGADRPGTPGQTAFGSERTSSVPGGSAPPSEAHGITLSNGLLKIVLDPATGGIVELRAGSAGTNLADPASGQSLNEYLYFNGEDASTARSNGPVAIRVKEKGPLVASLLVESSAPGCYSLTREIKLIAGQDFVQVDDLVDKQRIVVARSYRPFAAKESVNFAFPFNVPDGQVRIEVPYGVVRPDLDQIPGSCKNWFSADRWADVSNSNFGVTWVSLDTPLVQVGGLTANLLNSQTIPAIWRKTVGPTQKLYAWVMNNHWGTNYRAYQEGPVDFRFLLRPHAAYDPAAASRLAIAASQPLLPIRAHGASPAAAPRLTIESSDVLVTGLKPSDDGRAIIVRLWCASDREVRTRVTWSDPVPRQISYSDTGEAALSPAPAELAFPAWGVVTLRAETP